LPEELQNDEDLDEDEMNDLEMSDGINLEDVAGNSGALN
jgi:hypothetical protein